jgi:hypothetical protein
MDFRRITLMLLTSSVLLVRSSAQTEPNPAQPEATASAPASGQQTAPAPALGPANPSIMSAENPPISGFDQASLEPNLQPRSMLVGGVVAGESLDTNVNNDLNGNSSAGVHSVTRLLGGLTARRLWSRYDAAAAYVGGVGIYPGASVRNIQELQAEASMNWKTGRVMILDSFSYLPEGAFGSGAFGGGTGYQPGLGGAGDVGGLPGLGVGSHFGVNSSTQFGSLGQSPRITNVGLVDVVEEITPRSAFTAAGMFGVVHFTNGNPIGLINSNQFGGEAGYSHAITRHQQLGVIYGYSAFRYPPGVGADDIDSHIVQALYGWRISGRMDFIAGAGPQWTVIRPQALNTAGGSGSTRLSASARATFRYQFRRASVQLGYRRLDNAGSGFFAGAESDVVEASASRELARRWLGKVDTGYSHSKRLQLSNQGTPAGSFDYVFAGCAVSREFNRNIGAFVSYQYNQQVLNDLQCAPNTRCDNKASRHVVTFGVGWHFRPIRLD